MLPHLLPQGRFPSLHLGGQYGVTAPATIRQLSGPLDIVGQARLALVASPA
jgi:hypothetical protein